MVSPINVDWGQKGSVRRLLRYYIYLVYLYCLAGSTCVQHSDRCDLGGSGTKLTCSRGIHYPYSSGSNAVTTLVLCDWPTQQLDPESVLKLFPNVRELSVLHSNVSVLTSTFRVGEHLRKIKMSGLLIRNISKDTFQGLQNLQAVDLRGNRLQQLDEEALSVLPRLEEAFLAGNEWQCTTKLTWLVETSLGTKLKDKQQLVCAKYERKPLLLIMQFLKTLEQECPVSCSCIMDHVAWSYPVNVTLLPFHTVNCSHRGLQELPAALPGNTTTLLLQGNNISQLDPLASNPNYSRLNDVYLDDNLITSVSILEGSNWLLGFRILSLRKNFITEIPVYALDDAFAKNNQLARVYLGHNPWRCECAFVLSFQELMMKYNNIFGDLNDIRCAGNEDEDNSLVMIKSLARTDVCKEPIIELHRLTGLDILNISMAALIVLILGKLLYDYLNLKKTGKLPWIVMRMP